MKNFKTLQSRAKNNANSDAANIDLKPLFDDCMGDCDMLEELIGLYKKNILEFVGQTKINLENQDCKGLKFSIHKLKCSLLLLKTQDLFNIVEKMHVICVAEEDTGQLQNLFKCFLDSYPSIERAIDKQFLNLLNKE